MSAPDADLDFDFALGRTLELEGGYSNHSADRGGETMYGITAALARRHDYVGPMQEIPRDVVRRIYWAEFWDPLYLDKLESRWIAAEIFDSAVNMGPAPATKIAQAAANLMGVSPPLVVDGRMGPKTVGALNALSRRYEAHLYAALNGLQFMEYVALVSDDPGRFRHFIRGWMKRIDTIRPDPEELRTVNAELRARLSSLATMLEAAQRRAAQAEADNIEAYQRVAALEARLRSETLEEEG